MARIMFTLCIIMVILSIGFAHPTKYTVGDGNGWTFNVSDWPAGKQFFAGDVLVFKYNPGNHNVVVVDESGYNSCSGGGNAFTSGNDEIVLQSGKNFFICTFPNHCGNGMRIAIEAA